MTHDTDPAHVVILAQLVSTAPDEGNAISLSCNPDLTLDLSPRMREAARQGASVALLAQVNRNLPFMYGDAVVQPDYFDAIVDERKYDFRLFAPPNPSVSTVDHFIALYVSALIRDGGTLQLGIGAIGDAVTYALKLPHEDRYVYRDVLSAAGVLARFGDVIERMGGVGRFEQGLYGATEMLVPGFLELYRCGVLDDGHSILPIRSTRADDGTPRTNVRATYGNTTIPRHLRDIVVTEYGIADVRGRTDQDVATALIEIADSRFQDGLLHEAQQSGKVPNRYRIPDSCRGNRPEKLDRILAPFRVRGLFPAFPSGTDLTNEEVVLKRALEYLKHAVTHRRALIPRRGVFREVLRVPHGARPYLERMKLNAPRTMKDRILQRTVVFALASIDAI